MLKSKYILFAVFLLATVGVSAQKAERDYIRKGNRLFNDSVFVDAEVNYRKALEANPKSTVSMYNLGNTLSQQQKFQDAMEQYVSASKIEKDKMKLAHIYHNMGVLFQAGKDYAKAVDAYKMSLRNNPADHETRYNLALAQKMLKDQQNQQNQDQNQDQNKDQQKQDQKQDQNKDKQKDQKQDEKKDAEICDCVHCGGAVSGHGGAWKRGVSAGAEVPGREPERILLRGCDGRQLLRPDGGREREDLRYGEHHHPGHVGDDAVQDGGTASGAEQGHLHRREDGRLVCPGGHLGGGAGDHGGLRGRKLRCEPDHHPPGDGGDGVQVCGAV